MKFKIRIFSVRSEFFVDNNLILISFIQNHLPLKTIKILSIEF